ncbi:MAG: anaerobic sulfatase maturase [Promethearchaeota archaeon]
MEPFSLLIKPVSADCNLRCEYCFYIDHLNSAENKPRMSDDVLEKIIAKYMKTNQNNNYIFGWQGGEPTLMGLEFFKNVIKLQKRYAPSGATISNGLQTNGTLITDEMAEFFADYNFLIGVSLDGPAHLHNYYRKTINQKSSHSLVMRGIERLKNYNVEFNILTLINNETVKKGREIYQYLKNNNFDYHQYIPCIEFDENYNPKPFSITGKEWGNFLCDLFDEWIKGDINRVSIRLFDSILNFLLNRQYSVCYMGNDCRQYFVVEYDGNIYPCDFFVQKDLLLGNIMTSEWEDFLKSPIYHKFGMQKSLYNKNCYTCSYIYLCNGDCQKFRIGNTNSFNKLSVLCKGWKKFYTYSLPYFKVLAEQLRDSKKVDESIQIKTKKIGRNLPCPCGSGKKYKNCCL